MKNILRCTHGFLTRVLALLLFATPVFAQDVAANVGVIEVATFPDAGHVGAYPYAGVSLVLPTEQLTFVPGLAVEWSPELKHWGFVGTLAIDRKVTKRLGIDFNLALIHDQAGLKWGEAIYFAGAGPGCTVFFGDWGLSSSAVFFRQLDTIAWALVPGINAGHVF